MASEVLSFTYILFLPFDRRDRTPVRSLPWSRQPFVTLLCRSSFVGLSLAGFQVGRMDGDKALVLI